MRKKRLLPALLPVILILGVTAFAQAPWPRGKYTKEYTGPKTAHIENSSNAGKRTKIRGKLFFPYDGLAPAGAIISLYRMAGGTQEFVYSYLVGSSGKFYFRGLKKGVYMLKTGTIYRGFNSEDVTVRLAPKDRDSSNKNLEIALALGD